MTLTEIQKNIFNIAKGGGLASDDSRLNGKLIKFWIRYYRSKKLLEYTDFGKEIYPEIVQDLGCLTLTDTDKSECPNVEFGCKIKKVEIPPLVDFPDNRGLTFVGLIDKQEPFSITSPDSIYWTRFRRFTPDSNRAYMIGNTLYVVTPEMTELKYINVRGVFEDPTQITRVDSDGNTILFDEDNDNYPIMDGMVADLVEEILRKELKVALTTGHDIENDSLDNAEGKIQK